MGCKKGKCHRQALLAQFCYEHQKLECCMRKIRKNAEELCKILDSMPPKKEKEKENFMVLKQRKTVLIVSALLTAQMVMQEAVQAFEEVSQPEVQITETAQEGG